jgi:hypothetical protein
VPRLSLQRLLRLALLVPLVACATTSHVGLEPLVTDRPDFTDGSETVARGRAQLESGATYTQDGTSRGASLGEALLRLGVARGAELRLGFNSYAIAREGAGTVRGFEDASIGAKVKLLQGGGQGSACPTVAVLFGTSIPTGAAPFRSNLLQPEVKTIWAWTLTDRFSVSSNVNYSWIRDPRQSHGEAAATASFALGLTERVGSFAEYFGFFPQADGVERTHFANGGLTFVLHDNLQLDARAGRQLLRRADGGSFFVGAGLSHRW